jgi:hypothetical protein
MDDLAYEVLLETGVRIQPLPVLAVRMGTSRELLKPASAQEYWSRRDPPLNADTLFHKASTGLSSAKLLLQSGDADGACNRACYTMVGQGSKRHIKKSISSIPPVATRMNQLLTVLTLVGTHEVFFPNLDTVVPKNVVCGCNVKKKLWHAVFQGVVFNS